eukprot:Gb_27075 [translate_table: standard]
MDALPKMRNPKIGQSHNNPYSACLLNPTKSPLHTEITVQFQTSVIKVQSMSTLKE